MLRAAVESFSQSGKPCGCMLLTGAMNCTPANQGIQAYAKAVRSSAPEAIKQRLKRARKEGDIPADADIRRLASFYTTVAQGMAIRAGDGARRPELMADVDAAMSAWDYLTKPRRQSEARPAARQKT